MASVPGATLHTQAPKRLLDPPYAPKSHDASGRSGAALGNPACSLDNVPSEWPLAIGEVQNLG
jgi:hypothetical protein